MDSKVGPQYASTMEFFPSFVLNVPSHTASSTTNLITSFKKQLLFQPSYSADLVPCDFYLFPGLKESSLKTNRTTIIRGTVISLFENCPNFQTFFILLSMCAIFAETFVFALQTMKNAYCRATDLQLKSKFS